MQRSRAWRRTSAVLIAFLLVAIPHELALFRIAAALALVLAALAGTVAMVDRLPNAISSQPIRWVAAVIMLALALLVLVSLAFAIGSASLRGALIAGGLAMLAAPWAASEGAGLPRPGVHAWPLLVGGLALTGGIVAAVTFSTDEPIALSVTFPASAATSAVPPIAIDAPLWCRLEVSGTPPDGSLVVVRATDGNSSGPERTLASFSLDESWDGRPLDVNVTFGTAGQHQITAELVDRDNNVLRRIAFAVGVAGAGVS